MSVVDGSNVDAANTNANLLSRTAATTSTASVVTLNNAVSGSGPSITNLQASVNASEPNLQNLTTVLNGAALTLDEEQGNHIIFLKANSGTITLSSTPFGASFAGLDGTRVSLVGRDDTDNVLLLHSDVAKGVLLNGNADLGKGDSLNLVWSTDLDRWVELSRNF